MVMSDRVALRLGERALVTIEAVNSPYPQGVGFGRGAEVYGERVDRGVVWDYFSVPPERRSAVRNELPFSFEVVCRNKSGHLLFYNMTEYMGRADWWSGGSAMWIEELPDGRRYHCNDADLDDDFEDLVFTVRQVEGEHTRNGA